MNGLERVYDGEWNAVRNNFDRLGVVVPDPLEAVHYVGDPNDPGTVSFTGAWVHNDNGLVTPTAGQRNAGFWKDPNGIVRLTGVVRAGVSGTSVFTLPPGYRPSTADHSQPTICFGGIADVAALSSGQVLLTNFVGTPNVNVYCYLDGIWFRAGT